MGSKQKILVVEDDPLIGEDLTNTLSGFNYTVLGPIVSGEEVLTKVKDLNPDFILMDINLAGTLDGIQTAEALQKLVQVPVVFLSALNDEVTLQRAKLTNPYGYLIKPFDGMELRSTIELTLHRFEQERAKGKPTRHDDEDQGVESSTLTGDTATFCAEYFSKLKLFNSISRGSLESLAQLASVKEFNAGEFICLEGSDAKGGFIPISGRVSVTKTADSGKELIVALLAPGDIFGLFYHMKAFSGATSARTQIDSRVIWVPKSDWEYCLQKEPQLYKNLAEALGERLNASYTLSSSLAHARVEGRIISTLLAPLPDFGKSSGKNAKDGRIYITRKELSELTGTTPETAIRVTKQLERQDLLDLSRPGVIKIPDIDKLRSGLA